MWQRAKPLAIYISERADGRFNICNGNGAVTTRATREAAESHIAILLANSGAEPQQRPTVQPQRSSSRLADRPVAFMGDTTQRNRKRKEVDAQSMGYCRNNVQQLLGGYARITTF